MKTLKETPKEIWMVNGHKFQKLVQDLDYCIKRNFAITDEKSFDYFKTRVHCLNFTNLPEQY
jgi:hypothetical protein